MMRIASLTILTALITAPLAFAEALPTNAVNFRLIDHTGHSHEFFRLEEASAVVVMTVEPGSSEAGSQIEALQALQADFAPEGVSFLGISADPAGNREAIAAHLEAAGVALPVLMDTSQTVVQTLGLTRAAEAVVVSPAASWAILYRGAASEDALRPVLQAMVDGTPVPAEPRLATGSAIDFAHAGDTPSFVHDIAPILEEKCISCHHLGGIGPFAFSSLRRVRGWAPMMAETILTDRMPPWHADPHHGDYRNSLALTDEERATLLAWIRDGAPDDLEGADDPLELAAELREPAWTLGEPDLVLSLPEVEELPATGVVDYRYRYVPSGLTENKWVQAVEVQAGNPAVVHHALIFILYPKEYRHLQPDDRGGLNGYFAAFLPGAKIEPYPNGSAQWVPAGSTFVFQMHYTVTGKPETDQTRMALYFADEEPAYQFRLAGAYNTDFSIPPHAADAPARASFAFEEPAMLWAASPHMHYRGSRFRFEVRPPDGEPTTVLSVPKFDFNWQPLYNFAEPVPIAAGTTVYCEGAFDNTRFNPLNPDPTDTVTFGEQSFEEMFIGYLGYTIPADNTDRTPLSAERIADMGLGAPITAESLAGTTWRVGRQFVLEFKEGGQFMANNQLPGTWRIEGTTLYLESAFRNFELPIVGDELFFQGRSMRVAREGDDSQQWEGGRGGGERRQGQGQGRPQSRPQGPSR